jgi:hypothetical protein
VPVFENGETVPADGERVPALNNIVSPNLIDIISPCMVPSILKKVQAKE